MKRGGQTENQRQSYSRVRKGGEREREGVAERRERRSDKG